MSVYVAGVLVVDALPTLRRGSAIDAFFPVTIGRAVGAGDAEMRRTNGGATVIAGPLAADVRLATVAAPISVYEPCSSDANDVLSRTVLLWPALSVIRLFNCTTVTSFTSAIAS